jgi:UDP-N-acetylmuramoyl-tripeptide--D-alanyl-D-alanine ligase
LEPVSLSQLADITGGTLHRFDSSTTIHGVSISSRDIKPGELFAAFVGEKADGHQFIGDAEAQGASAALVSRMVDLDGSSIPLLEVSDVLSAIRTLAQFERKRFTGPVVGITGSNGKTTTKDMLAAVFAATGSCTATAKNLNNELGLPLTILRRTMKDWALILEMGMRGKGQIAGLCDIAQPTIGIITNIGQSHIELLGSQEGIALAKAELLESLPETGAAILRAEDPWLRRVANLSPAKVHWYGNTADADARAESVRSNEEGTYFDAIVYGQRVPCFIRTFGAHNVSNALAALLAGAITNVNLGQAAEQLARLAPSSGRLRFVGGKRGGFVIDDCYNASPVSMQASLDVLVDRAGDRQTVAVLGDMYELGDFAESGHRAVGMRAANLGVDTIVCIGQLGTWIADEAKRAGARHVVHYETKEQAIADTGGWLPDDAAVLVKASRGLGLEAVVEAIAADAYPQSRA